MKQRLKVYDYATRMRISVSTVYRQIKAGKLESETIDDVLYVLVDEEQLNSIEEQDDIATELRERIAHQDSEIEYLRNELSEARQRSDTIILQLTKQLENKTVALEDMRNRSFWQRIKMAFIRVGAPPVTEQRRA